MKKNLIIIIILLLTFNSLNVSAISKEGDLKIEKEEIQGIKNGFTIQKTVHGPYVLALVS